MKKALIICDLINEIVHQEGKFVGKGYAEFIRKNNVLSKTNLAIKKARDLGYDIFLVKVGFNKNYDNQPKTSPLFGKAHEFGALKLNTWATEFHEKLDVQQNDTVIIKNRVSPFYKTSLDLFLKERNIHDIYLSGCATDLVISSAVRDAHDRDYNVFVLQDCCAASSLSDHLNSIHTLKKISTILNHNDLI
jgi:nicotinamidase-related amidase